MLLQRIKNTNYAVSKQIAAVVRINVVPATNFTMEIVWIAWLFMYSHCAFLDGPGMLMPFCSS